MIIKAQAKTDISKTSEEDKKSKVAVEINDVEEYAEGDSVSCTAYADGTATYYVNGKQVKLTEDELKKLEKDGKVTIKIKNLKRKIEAVRCRWVWAVIDGKSLIESKYCENLKKELRC